MSSADCADGAVVVVDLEDFEQYRGLMHLQCLSQPQRRHRQGLGHCLASTSSLDCCFNAVEESGQ